MQIVKKLIVLGFLALSSCIGIDVLDWEIMEPRVVITTRLESLAVGETFQLQADYFDTLGELSTSVPVSWSSSNESLLTVSGLGVAEAVDEGQVWVIATAGEAIDSLEIESGGETKEMTPQRKANLRGLGSYSVRGVATLIEQPDGSLKLEFSSNFSASSGPGLHVYLSNNGTSVAGGEDLGSLKQNSGAHSYDVPASITLATYNHVIIYCKPFGVAFGNGQFQE